MSTCYKCNSKLKIATTTKEDIELNCLRCPKCKEEYFTSSELLKFDILTGRQKLVRKFGTLGDSVMTRIPPKILNDFNINPGDYAVFKKLEEGILIKPISAKELEI